ncbi:hypothetical protein [Amycolatopsis thailandensis]|uniref:hypothetical protein n=1 Tax=Amycolatopsis thailandensis TaxID=589330 RepID=UPI001177A98A|nr:hypothetical protein [Amycolatopsis thailandensis]
MNAEREPFFNIAETAGFYSQLAGVLAGFAFAGIMVLLTARMTPSSRSTQEVQPFAGATRLLIVSLVGLILSSLNYAILAGDLPGSHRSASLELVSGVGFGAAGLSLIYAIVLTIDGVNSAAHDIHQDLKSVGEFLRAALATVLTPLIFALIYLGVQDFTYTAAGPGVYAIDIVSWILLAVQFITGIVSYRQHSHSRQRKRLGHHERERRIKIAATVSFGVMISTTISFATLAAALYDNAANGPWLVPYVAIAISFLGAISFARHLARTRP